jgi:hypothetical protein
LQTGESISRQKQGLVFPKTLALLNQAFRADVRQLRTHLLRGAVAGGVLWLLAIVHDSMRWMSAPGLEFFGVLAWLSLVLLSLAGAFYFCSVITEEKEQQTLGLLRMAGVGPGTLLVGKSLGRLSVMLLLMTITLPYWWLAVTLGGVTLTQVAATGVILATHLIFVSQIGTLCSVIFQTTGQAAVAACLLIAGIQLGPLLLYEILVELRIGAAIQPAVLQATHWLALSQLEATLQSGYSGGLFESQAMINTGAAAGLFCLSWALFDRFNTYDSLEGVRTSLWRRAVERIQDGFSSAIGNGPRTNRPPRRASGNAIIWKDFWLLAGGRKWQRLRMAFFGVCTLGSAFLLWIWLFGAPRRYFNYDHYWGWELGAPLMIWMMFFAAIEAAYLAGHVFQRELKEQTWDSLRMLPISLRSLCGWKILGCSRALLPAVAFFLLGLVIDCGDWSDGLMELWRWPIDITFCGVYLVISTLFALCLICFFSLKTNPWLGLVLAAAAFGFTVFSGLFCGFELFELDRPNRAFVVFWANSLVEGTLILILHTRIARMLRGEDAAG